MGAVRRGAWPPRRRIHDASALASRRSTSRSGIPPVLGCRGGYATSYTPAPSAAVNRSGLESAPARAGFAEKRIEELDRENAKPIKAEAPEEEQTRGTVSAFPMAHRSPEGAGRPLGPPLAGGFFDDPARPEG